MKSYTDIEQSKKLADILPIESADMWWRNGNAPDRLQFITPTFNEGYCQEPDVDIPCWSLAALKEQLPDDLIINGNSAVLWMGKKQVCYYRRDDDTSVFEYLSKGDNLLDAIVEMIKMLKSRNLL